MSALSHKFELVLACEPCGGEGLSGAVFLKKASGAGGAVHAPLLRLLSKAHCSMYWSLPLQPS